MWRLVCFMNHISNVAEARTAFPVFQLPKGCSLGLRHQPMIAAHAELFTCRFESFSFLPAEIQNLDHTSMFSL